MYVCHKKIKGRLPNIYIKIIIVSRKVGLKGALWNYARGSWFNNDGNKTAALDLAIVTVDKKTFIDITFARNLGQHRFDNRMPESYLRIEQKVTYHSKW